MKTRLFSLMVIVVWLGVSPARALTYYDYNVDFAFGGSDFTGTIQTNCDACDLNSANFVRSWSLTATDGSSVSSSESAAEIVISVPGSTNILQATSTGIYTLANPTLNGAFQFCGDTVDCLNIYNVFHGGPQPAPFFELAWIEGATTIYQFGTYFTSRQGGEAPVIQIAALADTVECTLGNGGQLCVTTPAPLHFLPHSHFSPLVSARWVCLAGAGSDALKRLFDQIGKRNLRGRRTAAFPFGRLADE